MVEIKASESSTGPLLQLYTRDKELLIGQEGRTLDDLQFLLNRLLQAQDPASPKAFIDIEHYRQQRKEQIIEAACQAAQSVRETGKPIDLEPMNAYDRRLIHGAFADDPSIITWSPSDDARIKRITLKKR